MRGSNGLVSGMTSRNNGSKLSPLVREESEESSDSDSLGKYLRDEAIGRARVDVGGLSPTLSIVKLIPVRWSLSRSVSIPSGSIVVTNDEVSIVLHGRPPYARRLRVRRVFGTLPIALSVSAVLLAYAFDVSGGFFRSFLVPRLALSGFFDAPKMYRRVQSSLIGVGFGGGISGGGLESYVCRSIRANRLG